MGIDPSLGIDMVVAVLAVVAGPVFCAVLVGVASRYFDR